MTLQEFAALKVGDKIENWMSGVSHGTVTDEHDNGVSVQWGASTVKFRYSVNSTAWMHWSKAELEAADEASRQANT